MTTVVEPVAPDTPRKRRKWVVALLSVGCALVLVMWVFIVFEIATTGNDKGAYQIQDDSWRPQAIDICRAATAERNELANDTGGFIEDPTLEQMQQRADIVDQATDIVEQMVADLVAIPVDNDRDREILAVFGENYRLIISDRRRYAERLRNGDFTSYNETVVAGGPVSNVVFDFTAGVKSNDIPECSPPVDLINTRAP
ncbi:MAG TPA: hypothetical protein VMS14_02505 [Ilumatobacteraceae bacterium]|nr:hypothetical protein [Ilumatobacteraceae bacterium]HUC32243.1 hypothetical protein [Ilumatobacteraceae bacterium]